MGLLLLRLRLLLGGSIYFFLPVGGEVDGWVIGHGWRGFGGVGPGAALRVACV